jgi:S1-C subfamily serine protease
MRGYSEILGKLEPGQSVEVVHVRDGKEIKVTAAVEAR